MRIIPVIDIRNGEAVRAVGGRRADYQPLRTRLAATSAPVDVALALVRQFRFETLYVADLDAIEGRADNRAVVKTIGAALPGARLWVDAGAAQGMACSNIDVVIGSESLTDLRALSRCRCDPGAILSLDFLGDRFLGPPALLDQPELWPDRVIVMTLARVGADQGPDFERFGAIARRAGAREVFAAGGVRGVDDLLRLAAAGAAGALVSSALHDDRLTPQHIAEFAARKTKREPRGLPFPE